MCFILIVLVSSSVVCPTKPSSATAALCLTVQFYNQNSLLLEITVKVGLFISWNKCSFRCNSCGIYWHFLGYVMHKPLHSTCNVRNYMLAFSNATTNRNAPRGGKLRRIFFSRYRFTCLAINGVVQGILIA